jgi:hypothetical protein
MICSRDADRQIVRRLETAATRNPQPKTRIEFSAVVRTATGQTCNCASYPTHAMEITLAIWTFVEVSPSAFAYRERKIVTALLITNA